MNGRHMAWVPALVFALAFSQGGFAQEVPYVEDFVLAEQREDALKQLIPGTEDYYYYHALHYQHQGAFDQAEKLLASWIDRYGYTPRVHEIRHRQVLLTYRNNPQKTLDYLKDKLSLRFDHQRQDPTRKPELPQQLDPQWIAFDTLAKRALSDYGNLNGFEDSALGWLAGQDLSDARRRDLLQRLERPDHPELVALVLADLEAPKSGAFGYLPIHRRLLRDQMDALAKARPELLGNATFVQTYVSRLRPSNDVRWPENPAARREYLERLWNYAKTLPPVHNSLKAHVLYHLLQSKLNEGAYDEPLFMAYLKLPRYAPYVHPDFMKPAEQRRYAADLNVNYEEATRLPPIGTDEELVKQHLLHLFVEAKDYEAYRKYVREELLKRWFAEAKLLSGQGDAEKWYAWLSAAEVRQLKERVDIDFAPTNPDAFGPDDAVVLDVDLKNVKTLIIKVYYLNALSYYQRNAAEIDSDIPLDGLVANEERVVDLTDLSPLRRVRRRFEFDHLKQRGVYAIDFIGNGKSSRALIRKGALRHVVRDTLAGQVFTVFSESNEPLPNARVYVQGKAYEAGKNGDILVPYSNQPRRRPVILSVGDSYSLDYFTHHAENYQLAAGIYVDREQLLANREADILIRPLLYLNGSPISLSVLKDVRLLVETTSIDGVSATREFSDLTFAENQELTLTLPVPHRLRSISATLAARVKSRSQQKEIDLSDAMSAQLNQIDRTEQTADLFLTERDGAYLLRLLGKSGEPVADAVVQLSLKHRDFRRTVDRSLATNAAGEIQLGELKGIERLSAVSPSGVSTTWSLPEDYFTYHRSLSAVAGDTLEIPWTFGEETSRDLVSLLELRDGQFVADHFERLQVENGVLLARKLPAGDYDLWLKRINQHIRLRVTDGAYVRGYAAGEARLLELRGRRPTHIRTADLNERTLKIQVANADPFTRVHVFATSFEPAYRVGPNLGDPRDAEPLIVQTPFRRSLYVEGRDIGEEYRYIIERQYLKKHPGNMLQRPGLLLNPWAIRETETDVQQPREGTDFGGGQGYGGSGADRKSGGREAGGTLNDFSTLDFLAHPAMVLTNLKPDENGAIEIPRDKLADHQLVTVAVVTPLSVSTRRVSLPPTDLEVLDLRLSNALADKNFTRQKQVALLSKGDKFQLDDLATGRIETYDSLRDVLGLYRTLAQDAKLAEFDFLLRWPKLKPEEKREKYSEYASHELHFFLYKKDREFFNTVVKPYLENKKDKTFLDEWLLEKDLTRYAAPWRFSRLNVVEQILLGQRLKGEAESVARFLEEKLATLPEDRGRESVLFSTALEGKSLEDADGDSLLGVLRDEQRRRATSGRFNRQQQGQIAEMPSEQAAGMANKPLAPRPSPGMDPASPPANNGTPLGGQGLAREPAPSAKKADAGKDKRALESPGLAEKQNELYFEFKEVEELAKATKLTWRALDPTKEWVESNYYHIPREQQLGDLVKVNQFWVDFAQHDPAKPFYSKHFPQAHGNLTEIVFALSSLDLPFEAEKHEVELKDGQLRLTASGPVIVFHEQIRPAERADDSEILVSQNYFRYGDRYRYEKGRKFDKFVAGEFLTGRVYGCQIVVTNPTSAEQRLDTLVQIPAGSMPVLGSHRTQTRPADLGAYRTETLEYYFYFPLPGEFEHFPVQVASEETVVGGAARKTLEVVDQPSELDRESWLFVSQQGTEAEVLDFLREHNLFRLDLSLIAFRAQDKDFYGKLIALLKARHVYNDTLWSYAIAHEDVSGMQQYLLHQESFLNQLGPYLDSPLVEINPVERVIYQFKEYRPLVNARSHRLGKRWEIVNDRFYQQYVAFLNVLAHKPELTDEDRLALTYYLLLQDRVAEGLDWFADVNPENVATRVQYDYARAYLSLYRAEPKLARAIAEQYVDYPVDRWRKLFASVVEQVNEIEGKPAELVDSDDRTQAQEELAATEPSIDLDIEDQSLKVSTQRLKQVSVHYYLMDIELLFSRKPFVRNYDGQFSYIQPNRTDVIELQAEKPTTLVAIPDELKARNMLIEVEGADGLIESIPYFANSLRVQLVERYGFVQVLDEKTKRPAPKAYVKVYARKPNGGVQFYKDGYTDLRGRFDYASLSTPDIDGVEKFAVLVLSEERGAVVREADPPAR